MKINASIVFWCLLCWAVFNCSGSDSYKDGSELERVGNMWKQGDPIPAKLLEYRTSYHKGECFPDMMGTEMLFQGITNYSLLREIVFRPRLDARVFSNAVNSAVTLAGPTRFFSDSTKTLAGRPELARQDKFKAIEEQSAVKHIVVDSLYITYADMAPEAAKQVLNKIATELQTGKPWHDVYWKFMEAYEHPWQEKLSDGTVLKGTRTRIGNLGDFVLPANGNPLFSYREEWMPKAHIKKLFAAKAGDVVILFDKEDLSRYADSNERGAGERLVLYKAREVYSGKPSQP